MRVVYVLVGHCYVIIFIFFLCFISQTLFNVALVANQVNMPYGTIYAQQ